MNPEPALQQALHFLEAGQPGECMRLCNDVLGENPGLLPALYLRGCAQYELGDIVASISDLQVAHNSHPAHLHAAYYLGRSLRAAGRFEEALAPLQAALAEKEVTALARYELATCLTRLRRRPEAIEQYEASLKEQPDNAQVAANLALLLERENRLDEASNWVDKALEVDSANETAQMTRATLDRRDGKYAEATARLQGLLGRIDNSINRCIAWNQLGQSLEGQEDWDEAFDAYGESNRILKQHHPGARPDPRGPQGLQTLARIRTWLESDPMADWNEPATPDAGGIAFLVGFPRSGTTLLDRMLSAHPDIEVLEEKSLFAPLHQDWSQPGTLEALAEVSDAQIADARDIYRQGLSQQRRKPERPLMIDKLPLNLAYLFLIYRLFPEAPVIFLKRHPLDACISCYFQAFDLEASMAYFLDIRSTAEYYDAVMQVAARSTEQVGNPLHELRYEDLVSAPEDQLEPLLSFLGVPTIDAVLNYREQDGEISNTPSYQQVSQPLHTRSIGRWQHYSKQLEPGLAILQPWVERLGY